MRRNHRLAQLLCEPRCELCARLQAARVDADLREIEQASKQTHVPVRSATRADVPENAAVFAREMFRPDGGNRAGAHVGEARGIDHRDGLARPWIEQVQQSHF